MPRSKRNKIVNLTKTDAKGRDLKSRLIESLREQVDEYDRVFVLNYNNMRASRFKDIRMDWKESRIFLGKRTVAQVALGRGAEDEYKDNLNRVSAALEGNAGLLFTSRPKKEVIKYFKNLSFPEFANAGFVPSEGLVIPVGPVDAVEGGESIQVSMVDHLRKLGMVVEVVNGKLELKNQYVAAVAGEPLTPEQAKVLEHFHRKLATFSVSLTCHWSKAKCSFEEL